MQKRTVVVLSVMLRVALGAAAVEALHAQGKLTVESVIAYLDQRHNGVTAGTAILALLVSLILIFFTVGSMAMQRLHNRKSVLPIGHISVGDYENDIFVRLRNDGVGPMIIEKLSVGTQGSNEAKGALIDYMPDGIYWSPFVADISGRAISPEKDMTLLRLQGEPDDPKFAKTRRSVRKALSTLAIKVEYKNIYGERMPPATRNLSWFARH